MRYRLWIVLLCFTLFYSCQQSGTDFRIQTSDDEAHQGEKHKDSLIDLIKEIGDIVYDKPDYFLQYSDSITDLAGSIVSEDSIVNRSYQLLLLNIAYVLRQDAQILKSITFYEKALDLYYRYPDNELDFLEYYVKPLGSLYTMTGDLDKAVSIQYAAIEDNKYDHEKLASIYANAAITIRQMQLWDSAVALCHNGLEYTLPGSLAASRLYNELAICYLQLELVDSAVVYNNRSLLILSDQHSDPNSQVWRSTAISIKARLLFEARDYQGSLLVISDGIKILERHSSGGQYARERAKLYEVRGRIKLEQNKLIESLCDFNISLNYLRPRNEMLYPDNTISDCYYGLGKVYAGLGKPDSAVLYYMKSMENDYVVQQYITTKESSYYNSHQSRKRLAEISDWLFSQYTISQDDYMKDRYAFSLLWITELNKGRQLINEINRTDHWKKDDNLSEEIIKVQKDLRYLYESMLNCSDESDCLKIKNEIRNRIYKTSLSEQVFEKKYRQPDFELFSQKIEHTSRTHSVFSWQINNEQSSYLISVQQGRVKAHILGDNMIDSIHQFLNDYFYSGPQNFNNNPGMYRLRSNNILSVLIPDYVDDPSSRWILSLDGILFGLPVDALMYDHQFVIEEKELSGTFTLLDFDIDPDGREFHSSVVIFSKDKHTGNLSDLKYVQDEIRAVQCHVSSKVYNNQYATFDHFITALPAEDIIHISTHAVSDPDAQPYIVLDENINLDKLQFALVQSPLIILSACETAKGQLISGEGMESLNKAFLSKGFKAVIASHWKVNDSFIPSFMDKFYSNLIKVSKPHEALRKAKLEMISESGGMANPWEWASMSYTGEDIIIYLKSEKTDLFLIIVVVFAVICLLLTGRRFYKNRLKR